jgi:hypothetical protein
MAIKDTRLHSFEIDLSGNSDEFVKMDGEEIRGVRDILIKAPMLGVPTITLEILASEIKGKVAAALEIFLAEYHEAGVSAVKIPDSPRPELIDIQTEKYPKEQK